MRVRLQSLFSPTLLQTQLELYHMDLIQQQETLYQCLMDLDLKEHMDMEQLQMLLLQVVQ